MPGMSERQYAAHVGLSRGAVQKAKTAGRLVLLPDGSIDAEASDARRTAATDPAKSRPKTPKPSDAKSPEAKPKVQPVAEAALGSVRETLKEQGLPTGRISFVEARTAHEIAKAHLARLRLQEKKGALVDRARALAVVFKLARSERDSWINWPARAAALMAAELSASCSEAVGHPIVIEAHVMQKALETHVRAHLDELAEVRPDFR